MSESDVLLATIHAAAQILTRRLILLFGMASSFALAIWAMASPSWLHGAFALGYAIMAWIFTNISGK